MTDEEFRKHCYEWTLIDEGGADNDPDDNGGPTTWGIDTPDFTAWRKVHPGGPIGGLSKEEACQIYTEFYWEPLSCRDLPQPVAYIVFDSGLLHGIGRAAIWLQLAVGARPDGEIGPITIGRARSDSAVGIIQAITQKRLSRAKAHPDYWKFGRGWINRITRVKTRALKLIESPVGGTAK